MRCFWVVLLAVWVSLHATARGLLAADCDSIPQGLLLLEDAHHIFSTIDSDTTVTLEGFVNEVHSPQHFVIQV